MTKEEFLKGQLDFYQAVIFFTRPMMQLASRLDTYEQRWPILENIIEEHGDGLGGKTHGAQFRLLLQKLGISQSTLQEYTHHPCVEVFNLSLLSVSTHKDWRFAVAVLGIIEDRFAEISGCIGNAIVQNDWLSKEKLCHYTLHEALDRSHAADFYQLIQKEWAAPLGRAQIAQGLRFGNYMFLDLYRQLWSLYCQRSEMTP